MPYVCRTAVSCGRAALCVVLCRRVVSCHVAAETVTAPMSRPSSVSDSLAKKADDATVQLAKVQKQLREVTDRPSHSSSCCSYAFAIIVGLTGFALLRICG